MSSISAVAGKSLTLKCPAAGYPIDSIVWEKGKSMSLNVFFYKLIELQIRWNKIANKYVTTCL